MKYVKTMATVGLASALLFGCGNADNNDQFTDQDENRPLGVRYNPNDNGNHTAYDTDNGMADRDEAMNDRMNDNHADNGLMDNGDRNQKMDIADDAANKVNRMKEVENTYVMVTDNNAFVAVKLNDTNGKLNKDLEKKIRNEVKKTDNNIDKVYISANPDFYGRMQGYGDELRNGNPISGLYDEFTKTIRRVFPNS